MELAEALAPLLGSLCRRRIAKEKCDVDEARSKDGFSTFDVLCFVYQCGQGAVEMKKLLHVGVGRQLLAEKTESTGGCRANADDML